MGKHTSDCPLLWNCYSSVSLTCSHADPHVKNANTRKHVITPTQTNDTEHEPLPCYFLRSTAHTNLHVLCVILIRQEGVVTERERSTWRRGEDTGWWHDGWVEIGAIRPVRESFCPSSPVEQEERNWQRRFSSSPSSSFFLLLTTGAECQQPRRLVSVIKRESERKKERYRQAEKERDAYARQKKAGGRNVFWGKKEKINVSSLLQIQCRLKSRRNPQGNRVGLKAC